MQNEGSREKRSAEHHHKKGSSGLHTRTQGPGQQEKQAATKPHRTTQELSTTKTVPSVKAKQRTDKLAEGVKGPGSIRRIVSLDELLVQPQQPQRTSSGSLTSQKPVPRKLRQRFTAGLPDKGEKVWPHTDLRANQNFCNRARWKVPPQDAQLPILAPLERKILAVVGERDWVRVDGKGQTSVLRRNKHAITHELGIQIRDLRLLDPLMTSSYPSSCQRLWWMRTPECRVILQVCKDLSCRTAELEVSVRPMVGMKGASKVTSDYLEKLRKVKTRLVRLRTRVETLKEVLEKYLDDEDDMRSMHLSGRITEQKLNAARRLARHSLRKGASGKHRHRASDGGQGPAEQGSLAQTGYADVQTSEVEMLLGAYYMNLDSMWNKLVDLAELLDDAMELMDLEMDTYRNNIIRMKVFLGACQLVTNAMWAIANILGMNLGKPADGLFWPGYHTFVEVNVISCGGLFIALAVLTIYLHWQRLAITAITL